MKRNVLIFGLVLGILLCINMVYAVNLCYTNPEMEPNDILGYAVMVVIFSITFFVSEITAIKNSTALFLLARPSR